MATDLKMLTASFRNHTDAAAAMDWLNAHGYRSSDVNVLMTDATRQSHVENSESSLAAGSHATEGMGVGGAIGTMVGAAVGAIAAIGTSIAIPGLGLIVAGPIMAALAGGGAGAVTGGVVGGLIGLGIPESNAKAYEVVLREGGVVLGVVPRNDNDDEAIREYFQEMRAENIVYAK